MKTLLIFLALFLFSTVSTAEEYNSNKTVTLITAQSSADGSTKMYTEILESCIDELPVWSKLIPSTTSRTTYLRSINGKKGNDDHVKMYSAEITISYIEAQKMLIVLTQESIQAQEPKTETYDKRIQKKIHFVSDSNNGTSFANQSHRIYYFDSAEAAKNDVISQAKAWLSQNSATLCK